METRFANLFFEAVQAKESGSKIPEEWQSYYSNNSLKPLQYLLLGINIHINENIWEALTAEFAPTEMKEFKSTYFECYHFLKNIYSKVYDSAWNDNRRIRKLHVLTFGLDKIYGKIILKRWRRKQFSLAEHYFTDPCSFQKSYAALKKKVASTNNLIKKLL